MGRDSKRKAEEMTRESTSRAGSHVERRWILSLEPVKFGMIVGLFLWVARAPFGFFHPDDKNWLFYWRLAPIWHLWVFVGAAIIGITLLLLAFVFVQGKARGSTRNEAIRSFCRALSPVYFLLLGLIQLVPGALGILPVLPLLNKLILPVAVFSSVLFLLVIESKFVGSAFFQRLDRSVSAHKWRWTLILFIVSLMVYGVFMKRCNSVYGYGAGDEAHYLIQARSLAEDFDRDLINQLPDYSHTRLYYYEKHLSEKSPPGKAHSKHYIGLPLLLAPGWLVADMKGALGAMIAMSALFAVSVFWIAFKLSQRSGFALSWWAVFCFTTPIVLYASRAYPGLPAALVILFVVWKLTKPEFLSRWGWLALGCLIGFLPWLHTRRFCLPTLLLAVWGMAWIFLRGKKKDLAFLLPPLFVSLVLLIVLNQHWYGYSWGQPPGAGGFDKLQPAVWVGGYRNNSPRVLFLCWPGLIGAMVDRFRGLIVCSPFYLIPLACVFVGLCSRNFKFCRRLWLWVFLAVYVPSLSVVHWFAGECFPGRYMVPGLPLLVFPLTGVLARHRDRVLRAMFAVLAAFGVWITLRMALAPGHFYRGVVDARWQWPVLQLVSLFYPYVGPYNRELYHIEDPLGVVMFMLWAAGAIVLLQWTRKREISAHRSFHLALATILALPLFAGAVRRLTNCHPYQLSVSGPERHYLTLTEINRASSSRLIVAKWGEIPPQVLKEELTLELPAAEEESKTGEIRRDECTDQEVVVYDPERHAPGHLSYTRPLRIAGGQYVARFWIAAVNPFTDDSLILCVQDMKTLDSIASRRLSPSDFAGGKGFSPISVSVPFAVNGWSYLRLMVYVDAKCRVGAFKFSIEPGRAREIYESTAAKAISPGLTWGKKTPTEAGMAATRLPVYNSPPLDR